MKARASLTGGHTINYVCHLKPLEQPEHKYNEVMSASRKAELARRDAQILAELLPGSYIEDPDNPNRDGKATAICKKNKRKFFNAIMDNKKIKTERDYDIFVAELQKRVLELRVF